MAHGGRYGRLLKHGMHNDMMKCKPVYAWLEMAQDDDVLIDPDDINHEVINNMWSFSPTEEETPQIHAADIVEFVGELIAARSSALVGEEILFYCWHDASPVGARR